MSILALISYCNHFEFKNGLRGFSHFQQTLHEAHIYSWGDGSMGKIRSLCKTPWSKPKLGRKGFIWLTLPDHNPSLEEVRTGTQAGLGLGGRSWSRDRGGCCLLACFLMVYSACFFIEPRTTSPRDGIIYHGLDSPSLIEKCHPPVFHGSISSTEVPFFLKTLARVKLNTEPAIHMSTWNWFSSACDTNWACGTCITPALGLKAG